MVHLEAPHILPMEEAASQSVSVGRPAGLQALPEPLKPQRPAGAVGLETLGATVEAGKEEPWDPSPELGSDAGAEGHLCARGRAGLSGCGSEQDRPCPPGADSLVQETDPSRRSECN